MVVLTIIVAVNAFAAAKGFRLYTLAQRKALLKPRLENFSGIIHFFNLQNMIIL